MGPILREKHQAPRAIKPAIPRRDLQSPESRQLRHAQSDRLHTVRSLGHRWGNYEYIHLVAASAVWIEVVVVRSRLVSLYGECMARLISTTVRLAEEDVRALKRARAAGYSASELVRKGLRVVAARYYSGRRRPSTRLFESADMKLGDESELFRELED